MDFFTNIEFKDLISLTSLLTPIFMWMIKKYIQESIEIVRKEIEKAIAELEKKFEQERDALNEKLTDIDKRVLVIETNFQNKNESIERIESNVGKLFTKFEEFTKDFYKRERD